LISAKLGRNLEDLVDKKANYDFTSSVLENKLIYDLNYNRYISLHTYPFILSCLQFLEKL
jgi:hypothetical protein